MACSTLQGSFLGAPSPTLHRGQGRSRVEAERLAAMLCVLGVAQVHGGARDWTVHLPAGSAEWLEHLQRCGN